MSTDKVLNFDSLYELVLDLSQEPVLIVDVKLVFEFRSPQVLSVKGFHASQKGVLEVLFGDSDALYLLKSSGLLLSLGSGNLERLILGFDAGDFSLDLLFPAFAFLSLTLEGTVLETANLFKLCFLLNLKQSLFNGL